jgi:hypothetical protein
MHSIEYNYAPKALVSTWQKNSERNVGHDLQNENDYYLPHPRLEFFIKIPLYSLPAGGAMQVTLNYSIIGQLLKQP